MPTKRELMRLVAGCIVCAAAALRAAEPDVSPAFVFDARYPASGVTPVLWAANEAVGLSALFALRTKPLLLDSDGDGLPDVYELAHGLDPARDDAGEDPDGDGRTNRQEFNAGTNPVVADDWTKSAGASGAFETDTRVVYVGGHPVVSNLFAVARISNLFVCDTGGLYYDWDGDGIPNWWEARFSRSKTGLDAESDADGDGRTALDEFVAYTDPTNAASFFSISIDTSVAAAPSPAPRRAAFGRRAGAPPTDYEISWPTAKGRIYKLYATDNLKDGWDMTPVATVEGTGDPASVPVGQDEPVRFFRVEVELAPTD